MSGSGKGMRAQVVSPQAAALTRAMNGFGKEAQAVFRDTADVVAKQAARELAQEARGFSRQSRALGPSIQAKRDRVPYVHVKPQGIYRLQGKSRRTAVRAGHIALGTEYGRRRRGNFVTPRHGATPQRWRPSGWWWGPLIRKRAPLWERLWLDSLDRLLARVS